MRHLATRHGLQKVRLTGGDPTSRPDLIEVIQRLAGVPGILDLAMTTHGLTLANHADDYARAGLHRVNVSLDTLDARQFQRITGSYSLEAVLAGIDAALHAGLSPVRINAVVIRGENEEQLPALLRFGAARGIDIRFIELMPMGPLAPAWADRFVSAREIRGRLEEIVRSWTPLRQPGDSAKRYRVELNDGQTAILGFISPMSQCFCSSCDRLRVGADGTLYPCLMGHAAGSLLSAVRPRLDADRLDDIILSALAGKPAEHGASGGIIMTQIGG